MHHPLWDPPKALDNGLNRHPGCDLTSILSAYAVCDCEQPSMRLDLRGGRREHVADEVFVVLPATASVRKFRKFKIKHGALLGCNGFDCSRQRRPLLHRT